MNISTDVLCQLDACQEDPKGLLSGILNIIYLNLSGLVAHYIGLTNSTRYLIIWIILNAVDIVGNIFMLSNKPQIAADLADYHGFFISVYPFYLCFSVVRSYFQYYLAFMPTS